MSWKVKRARVAALARGVRAGERTQAELDEARRDLQAEMAEVHITRILAAAPPLSNAQRTSLAELLRPIRSGGAA